MTATVDEKELMQLQVGDFIGVLTHSEGSQKTHWTLGSVESPPYLHDVEIRLWEKQRSEPTKDDVPVNHETADLMERIASAKAELEQSIEQAEALTQQLRQRRASIMTAMGEAEKHVSKSQAVAHAARDDVESISDRHWQELKSYRIPPKIVPVVLRAVMLLLSEDEAREWPQMQRILRDYHFKSRITDYVPEKQLTSERREHILHECVSRKSFRHDRAMQGSSAIGPIYYWVLAQLDCGEAVQEKNRVDTEKISRQRELREVLKQINDQQHRIVEYQSLIDDLDNQLRECRERSPADASQARRLSVAVSRYEGSFAGKERKEYLRPAFYTWRPTGRVIIVLRKNVICDFGGVTSQEEREGYSLSEGQVSILDDALSRRRRELEVLSAEDSEERLAREQEEERELEQGLFKQNEQEMFESPRNDAQILEERQRQVAEGRLSPLPTPQSTAPQQVVGGASAGDRLQRRFEGKNWKSVLQRKRVLLINTFTEETAELLDVPESYVSVVDLAVGSLVVDFLVEHDGTRSKTELLARTNNFGYPKVMALYEEMDEEKLSGEIGEAAPHVPDHQMKFSGEMWSSILPEHRDEVVKAFLKDTTASTKVPRGKVRIEDVYADADGLTIDYGVKSAAITDDQVYEISEAYPYPCVWALYQRLAGSEDASQAAHQLCFRGRRWEELLREHEPEIRRAVASDTCVALDITHDEVNTQEITFANGLSVCYTVTDPSLTDDDIDNRVAAYSFPETWSLYDRLLAAVSKAKHQKPFAGEHWDTVLMQNQRALENVFQGDSADALKVKLSQIEVCSMDTDQDRLLVSYNIHDSALDKSAIYDMTYAASYENVWALYRQVTKQGDTSANKRVFDGEMWTATRERVGDDAIRAAIVTDVAVALGIAEERVVVTDVATDNFSMTVHYEVLPDEGDTTTDEERQDKLADYPFPNVWDMYEMGEEGFLLSNGWMQTSHQVGFGGDEWQYVMKHAPRQVVDTFSKCTAEALECNEDHMLNMKPVLEDGLLISFELQHPLELSFDEVNRRLKAYHYNEMWALYSDHPYDPNEKITTVHSIGFEGDDWGYVVELKRDAVIEAFRECTAKALTLEKSDVDDITINTTKEGIIIQCKISHTPLLDEELMQDELKEYAYEEIWSLYETRPYDPNEKTTTTHTLGFQGPGWAYVHLKMRQELESAVVKDTAEAVDVAVEDVAVTSYDLKDGSLFVQLDVQHSPLQDTELIQELLTNNPYEATWALYSEPEVSGVITRVFDGPAWALVLKKRKDALQEAFRKDTADVLCVHVNSVEVVGEKATETEGLEVQFITVGTTHPTEEVEQLVTDCAYPGVWELYPEIEEEELERETGELVRKFEGDDWDILLDNRPCDVERAFAKGVGNSLGVPESDVVIMSTQIGSLIVRYKVRGCDSTDDEVSRRVEAHDFPELMELYKGRVRSTESGEATRAAAVPAAVAATAASAVGAATPLTANREDSSLHEVDFEGDQWDFVMQRREAEVHDAIVRDTAAALGLTVDDVVDVSTNVTPTTLVSQVTVRRVSELTPEDVEAALQAFEYGSVWALYCPPSEAPVMTKLFEGHQWSCVSEADFSAAFVRDTAKALHAEPEDIDLRRTTDGNGRIAEFAVLFSNADSEQIARSLDEYAYPEVWALYPQPVMTSAAAVAADTAAASAFASAELDERVHHHALPGDLWSQVMEEDRSRLERAIKKDTADALDISPAAVHVVLLNATDDGLEVGCRLRYANRSAKEVDQLVTDYAYPGVWELYPEIEEEELERETGELVRKFEGDDWDILLDNRPCDVERAFAKGVGNSLGVPESDVVIMSTQIGSLIVRYKVRGCDSTDDEVSRRVEAHDFPELMELYKGRVRSTESGEATRAAAVPAAVAATAASAVGAALSESSLGVNFEGDQWGHVLHEKSKALTDAFVLETSRALDVPQEHITVTDFVLGSLLVMFTVKHPEEVSEAVMRRKLDEYPYEEVWLLYEEPQVDETRTTSAHEVGFEADNWPHVLERKRDALVTAFTAATAEACGVDVEDVQEVQMVTAPGMMQVSCHVTHPVSIQPEAINTEINKCEYLEVWSLYDDAAVSAEEESRLLTKVFEGDDWDLVLKGPQAVVEEAFRVDVVRCLNIPRDNVSVKSVRLGSLVIDYTVRGVGLDADEVEKAVADYEFPEVWCLYQPRELALRDVTAAETRTGPSHQRVFQGASWDVVAERHSAKLHDAFTKDTAEALQCETQAVQVTSNYATEEGLVVNYRLSKAVEDKGEGVDVDAVLRDADYPRMMALYDEPIDNEYASSKHTVGFDGEDWDYVMETKAQQMEDTFITCTADALQVPRENLQEVRISNVAEGLKIEFNVVHPKSHSSAHLDHLLTEYDYKPMWDLYETRPYDPSHCVTTRHTIGFEGEDWDYTVEVDREALEKAFVRGTANALQVTEGDVTYLSTSFRDEGITMSVLVTHSKLLDEQLAQEALASYPYQEVWPLYQVRPYDPSHRVTTVHRVGFEGDHWEDVLSRRRDDLQNALHADTSNALHVDTPDVTRVTMETSGPMLVATVSVQHSPLQDKEMIQNELFKYPFDRVWALYEDAMTPRRRVTPTPRQALLPSALLTRRFDGTDWDLALEAHPEQVRHAFAQDTADVLSCSTADVLVEQMTVGSLVVQYRLRHCTLSPVEVQSRVDHYDYPTLWSVYRSRSQATLLPATGSISIHR